MDKQGIIDYVLDTPTNTNPRILGHMLDEYGADGGGGGSSDFSIIRVGLMVDQLPSEDQARLEFPATYSDAGLGDFATVLGIVPDTAGETKYENAVAYKGVCGVLVDKPSGYNVEIEGDGEFIDGMMPTAFCRGDCVIKILTEASPK